MGQALVSCAVVKSLHQILQLVGWELSAGLGTEALEQMQVLRPVRCPVFCVPVKLSWVLIGAQNESACILECRFV
jgi:hypothetical protein